MMVRADQQNLNTLTKLHHRKKDGQIMCPLKDPCQKIKMNLTKSLDLTVSFQGTQETEEQVLKV